MSGTLLLLNLAGAVALLLWAVRMVRTGVERAFGPALRSYARSMMASHVVAAFYGLAMAAGMQSATAAALLISGFVGSGMIAAAAGLSGLLGADLGSAVVVKVLSYNLSMLVPVCLVAGTVAFTGTENRAWRQFGRIFVGIGLLLLSLRLIGEASVPLSQGGGAIAVVGYLRGDPITAFFAAAAFAWLVHSSVATVLLIVSIAARGLIPVELGIDLVLGANLGGALIPVLLTRGERLEARVPVVGNLAFRGIGAIAALGAVNLLALPVEKLGVSAHEQIINSHLAFNGLLALICLPLATPVSALVRRMLASFQPQAPLEPLTLADGGALDPAAIKNPGQALAGAVREVLRLAETIEIMLRRIFELYENADKQTIQQLRGLDDRVDSAHARIKLYLAKITAEKLTAEQANRCQELIGACIKLEQVGDIIVRNMLAHVQKKQQYQLHFSQQGWTELCELHTNVLANAQLAFNVLASRDRDTALQLMKEKVRLRDLEKRTSALHFERLREGTAKSIETSTIHLDTVRDLKQINSLLVSIVYPVLEEAGLLRESRLSEG